VLQNSKQPIILNKMKTFGDTIRQLRAAQDMGLRETAATVGISPAYLSRIERGRERPPRPEIVKALAKVLAADPDVLFRLSSSTDPDIVEYLHEQPIVLNLIRLLRSEKFTDAALEQVLKAAKKIGSTSQNDSRNE